ncbi:unnamed protein product [Fusarium graminearum]|nr:unnamed protein product [Fusarium graminearum]
MATTDRLDHQRRHHAEPQVFPNQAEACQGAEAEPPCAPVDSPPNWQHHPLQRQAKALAQDPHRYLSYSFSTVVRPQHPTFSLLGMVSRC